MKKKNEITIGIGLVFLEVTLLFAFFSFAPTTVIAAIGNPNATVITLLDIGNVYPDIVNVSINDDAASITMTPNATSTVSCIAVLRDYNGDADINKTNATFYHSTSSATAADDNNNHYTNSSCVLTADAGTYNTYDTDGPYHSLANCTFEVEYYADAGTWTCSVSVFDQVDWSDTEIDTISISQLLAIGLPDTINYGTVNATYVSNENVTNITNYGNVAVNISLEGYGINQNDGVAMNCTLGNVGNISIEHEKYNLTSSTAGSLSLSEFNAVYTNLTTDPEIKQFALASRTNDTVNKAINASYWRIYVPTGVAGTCNGTIIFGATTAAGT